MKSVKSISSGAEEYLKNKTRKEDALSKNDENQNSLAGQEANVTFLDNNLKVSQQDS